jgi:uncharacterized protein
VFGRPKFDRWISREARANALTSFVRLCRNVAMDAKLELCRDPRDNRILELVFAGGARVIVTGDADLLVIGNMEGAQILLPTQFCDLYGLGLG